MKRSTRIIIGVIAVAAVATLVVLGVSKPKSEQGLFHSAAVHTSVPVSPAHTSVFIGPTLGLELVPVAEAERKDQARVNGVALGFLCVSELGEMYYAPIPRPDHPGAHSKLDIDGHVLTITRLRDGSVQVAYDDAVTGVILGDDFAFAPRDSRGTYWISPESFGPIMESKIAVCVRRR